jgi:hypothetical protein
MSDQQNPVNDGDNAVNADAETEMSDTQLDQVAGGKINMVAPTAVELPAGEGRISTPGIAQGITVKKPGGFLPLP